MLIVKWSFVVEKAFIHSKKNTQKLLHKAHLALSKSLPEIPDALKTRYIHP